MRAGLRLALNVSFRHMLAAFFVIAGLLSVTFIFGTPKALAAQTVPYKINFQGRLTDSSGNAKADGLYNMKFKLYTLASGGSLQWSETRETTNRVQVTNGLFSVQLGDANALSPSLFTTQPLYFEIELPTTATATCSTASCATFDGSEIMSPRRPLGSSPYAMNSDTLDGIDGATFARQDTANTFTAGQLIKLDSTGALQIQKADSTPLFVADTQNMKITTGNLESNVAGALTNNVTITTVDNAVNAGSDSSIAMATDGFARISYYDSAGFDLEFIQCTNAACTTKNATTLDSAGSVGQFSSIAMASDGFARISYFDAGTSDLKFIQCTNASCSTKNTTTVDSTGIVGKYTSVTMASDGFARILYLDETNFSFKLAQCTNAACSTSTLTTVATNAGQFSSIAMASDGFARIGYYDVSATVLKFIQCTNAACSTKNTNTVDSSGNVGQYVSMAVGSDGFARMSYFDYTNQAVKFAQCTNTACSTSNTSSVYTVKGVNSDTSMALGTDGFARISFYDISHTDLKYVQCTNAACSTKNTTTIDALGSVGNNNSLALGTDGFARISYYDSGNYHLKFARLTSDSGQEGISGAGFGTNTAYGKINAVAIDLQGALNINNAQRTLPAVAINGGTNFLSATNNAGMLAFEITQETLNFTPLSGTMTYSIGENGLLISGYSASSGLNIEYGGSGAAINVQSDGGGAILNASGIVTINDVGDIFTQGKATATTGLEAPQLDTAAAGALGIGSTNATSISLGKTSGGTNIDTTVNGTATFKNNANSATAFQIQNAGGTALVKVDTASFSINNLLTNGSFETGVITPWAARSTATPVTDTTMYYNGSRSLKIPATAANDGAKQNVALSSSTTYSMSMYVRTSLDMTTLEVGRSENGSVDTNCRTAVTVLKFGWTKVTCSFKTGTVSGTTYVYVKQTDAVSRSIYVDGVTLETDANGTANYSEGKIELNGNISTAMTIQPAQNTTNALQVLSANGSNIFNVDNTDANLLAGFSGFEANTLGWSYTTSGGSVVRDSANAYSGTYSLKVVTAATANNGALLNLNNSATNSPMAVVAASAPYVISWYAKLDAASAAFTDMTAVYSPDGAATTACTAINTQTVVTGGWTRFICTLTTSATAQNTSSYIAIRQTAATAHTFYIDGVQMEAGSAASAYGVGSISFNAAITTPAVFQNKDNSVTAFTIQNSTSVILFSADTINNKIQIGSSTTDTNQVNLLLDSFSTYADNGTCSTTVNQGALYYNTNTNAVRACVNAKWDDLVTTAGLGLLAYGIVPDSGSTNPGDLSAAAQATTGVSGPCKATVGATTATIAWTSCTAYTNGRKQIIAAGTAVLSGTSAGQYINLCVFTAGSAPTLGTAGTEATATVPTWSATDPAICLASIKIGSSANTVGQINDSRAFTTSQKTFATLTTLAALSSIVKSGTTAGQYAPAAATTDMAAGILVLHSGSTSTTTPNAIVVTSGPTHVRMSAAAAAIGNFINTSATSGTGAFSAAASATVYATVGVSQTQWSGSATNCAINTICEGAVFAIFRPR